MIDDLPEALVYVDGTAVRLRVGGGPALDLDAAAASRAAQRLADLARRLDAAARLARGRR
jgi:hypothetical protein